MLSWGVIGLAESKLKIGKNPQTQGKEPLEQLLGMGILRPCAIMATLSWKTGVQASLIHWGWGWGQFEKLSRNFWNFHSVGLHWGPGLYLHSPKWTSLSLAPGHRIILGHRSELVLSFWPIYSLTPSYAGFLQHEISIDVKSHGFLTMTSFCMFWD